MEQLEEKTLYLATLVFPIKGNNVLMAEKMKKIGKGNLNGWGGGVENGETIIQCACREFQEETGGAKILPADLKKIAIIHFHNIKSDGTVFVCTVHIFVAEGWIGKIVNTDEMRDPRWVLKEDLPKMKLMPADFYLFPFIFENKPFIATAHYGPFQATLLEPVEIKFVDSFVEG